MARAELIAHIRVSWRTRLALWAGESIAFWLELWPDTRAAFVDWFTENLEIRVQMRIGNNAWTDVSP